MPTVKEIGGYALGAYVGAPYAGLIYLYDTSGLQIGTLHFKHNNKPALAPTYDNDIYNFYYRNRDWPRIVDMLRNEKPVYLVWYTDYGYVGMFSEPVGEGEVPTP